MSSTLNAIQDALGTDFDDNSSVLIIKRSPTQFDKACDELTKLIVDWKTGNSGNEEEYNKALEIIDWIKNKHHEFQVLTSEMSQEILILKESLKQESKLRSDQFEELNAKINKLENDNHDQFEELNAKINKLENDKHELRRVMLVRAMSTSLQHAITLKFPGEFSTKYSYSCTYEDVQKKMRKRNDPAHNQSFNDITNLFTVQGVEVNDIPLLIKNIRELGIDKSHPTTMIDELGNEYLPSSDQMKALIEESDLPNNVKIDAQIMLNVLASLVPAGDALFYNNKA